MSKKDNSEIDVEPIKEEKKILPAGSLPQSVLDINKKYKTTKITTLDKAKSFNLKRMFTGSILLDELTGGGWGYKRIQMQFGYRSSGKNAIFNQTIAYNQRICRHCLGILSEEYNNEHDRHARFLRYVLGMPECKCDNPVGRIFLVLDYEKSLAIEGQKIIIVRDITDKKTEEKISEIEYDERVEKFNILSEKSKLEENEQIELKVMEKWFKGLTIEEQEIIQESTTDYLIKCGVKVDKLLVADPEDTEEGVELVRPLIKSISTDGIIWDSLQAATPKYIILKDASEQTMGAQAKSNGLLMSHIFSSYAANDLTDEHEAYKPAFFISSQMRSSLGGFIAKQDSFSGGHSVAHACSFINELKREKYVNKAGIEVANFKESFYGQKIRMRAEKNKMGVPGNMYEITYYFKDADNCKTGEIDHTSEIITLGIENGKIERRGNTYFATENDSFVGIEKLTTFFRENPEFVGKVYKNIKR